MVSSFRQKDFDQSAWFRFISMLPGNVYYKDLSGRYLYCNEGMVTLLGLNHCDEIIGKTDKDMLNQNLPFLSNKNEAAILTEGEKQIFEEEIIGNHGKLSTYLTHKIPFYNASGQIIGLVNISIEITETKRVKRIEKDSEAKTLFIANMSHDLRTPIAGITALVETLITELSHPDFNTSTLQDNLEHIKEAANQSLTMINDILQSMQNDQETSVQEAFHLSNTLREILVLLKPTLLEKGLYCKFEVDHSFQSQIRGPNQTLKNVLLNLMGNALKFTDKGGITIKAHPILKNSQPYLKVSVADTGNGIPKDKQTIIFDPFSRLTASIPNRYPGSGLGLYLVKKMLMDIEGSISVESHVNQGTTFTCIIPIEFLNSHLNKGLPSIELIEFYPPKPIMGSSNMPSLKTNLKTSIETHTPLTTPMTSRILLVEDDRFAKIAGQRLLNQQHCHVDVAITIQAALNCAQQHTYDLILTDFSLPDGEACQLIQAIRKPCSLNQSTPIIILTAHIDASTREDCFAAGASDIYHKPLTQKKVILLLSTFGIPNVSHVMTPLPRTLCTA